MNSANNGQYGDAVTQELIPYVEKQYRGIGAGYTKFAIESMIDELAHDAKMDPLAYRLAHTDDGRARRVLEKVAEMSGWGSKPPAGRARGIAFAEYGVLAPKVGSLVAAVAEISVDRKSGRIRVHNYWAAADAGLVQAPSGVLGMAGIASALFVVVALLAGPVVALRAAWARVVVRVAGSWIAAIGLLMLGWTVRMGGA